MADRLPRIQRPFAFVCVLIALFFRRGFLFCFVAGLFITVSSCARYSCFGTPTSETIEAYTSLFLPLCDIAQGTVMYERVVFRVDRLNALRLMGGLSFAHALLSSAHTKPPVAFVFFVMVFFSRGLVVLVTFACHGFVLVRGFFYRGFVWSRRLLCRVFFVFFLSIAVSF